MVMRPECENGNECSDPGSQYCWCAKDSAMTDAPGTNGWPDEDALIRSYAERDARDKDPSRFTWWLHYVLRLIADLRHARSEVLRLRSDLAAIRAQERERIIALIQAEHDTLVELECDPDGNARCSLVRVIKQARSLPDPASEGARE